MMIRNHRPLARRIATALIVAACVALGPARAGQAAEPDDLTKAARKAASRGSKWLLGQQEASGRFIDRDYENAMAAVALLEAGTPMKAPAMQRLIAALVSESSSETRFLALRCEALLWAVPQMSGAARRLAEKALKTDLATLATNQHTDGYWQWRPGRFGHDHTATFLTQQALALATAGGYPIPDAVLDRTIAFHIARQRQDGGWSSNIAERPSENTDHWTTMRSLGIVALGTSRNDDETRAMLRERILRGAEQMAHPLQHWPNPDDKTRDLGHHDMGTYVAWFYRLSPIQTLGEGPLREGWLAAAVAGQSSSGMWQSNRPQDPAGLVPRDVTRRRDIGATTRALWQVAQVAKPVLVAEAVDELSKAVLTNRGLWTAVEAWSMRRGQPMRYDRVRLGLDLDRYRDLPVLYLTLAEDTRWAEKEKANLRAYVAGGGLIFIQLADTNRLAVNKARERLDDLWPGCGLTPLPARHPLLSATASVGSRMALYGMDDGVRTFLLLAQADVTDDWAKGPAAKVPAMRLFDNLIHYATEAQDDPEVALDRPKDDPAPAASPKAGPTKFVTVGQLRPRSAGEAQPPVVYEAWPHIAELVPEKDTGLKLLGPKPLAPSDEKLELCDVAHMTIDDGTRLTDEEAAAIADYLSGGGFLLMECRMGDIRAPRNLRRLTAAIGVKMADAKETSPLVTGKFDGKAQGFDVTEVYLRADGELDEDAPELELLMLDDRVVGLACPRDLSLSASGIRCYGLRGYAPTDARRIMANVVLSRTARD